MPGRTRTLTWREPSGTRYFVSQDALHLVSSGIESSTTLQGQKTCVDVTSTRPYTDHNLDLSFYRIVRARLFCQGNTFAGGTRTWKGDLNGYRLTPFSAPYGPTPSPPSWNYYSTKALANINPNRPIVDLPVLLFELREFPRMLRDLGRVLSGHIKPSDVPGGYLAYKFGWEPLFRDLKGLLDLSDAIDFRQKFLLDSLKKGGLHVRRKLGTNSLSFSDSGQHFAMMDGKYFAKGTYHYSGQEKAWFTARFAMSANQDLHRLRTDVFRSILGLRISAASIWEALPWSWLIDYFVNVGDILDANRGGIKFSVTKLNIMCHQTIKGVLTTDYLASGISISKGSYEASYKGRRPQSSVSRIAFRPFLTNGMRAILGSLVTARALRKFKL